MKKKIIRVMFFGALALTTFSYVGCKDYDDDIDRLAEDNRKCQRYCGNQQADRRGICNHKS